MRVVAYPEQQKPKAHRCLEVWCHGIMQSVGLRESNRLVHERYECDSCSTVPTRDAIKQAYTLI